MTETPNHSRLASLGEVTRDLSDGVFSTAARRPWATPQVILGTMQDAEGGANPNSDSYGTGAGTTNS
jgi:hypothetical protein